MRPLPRLDLREVPEADLQLTTSLAEGGMGRIDLAVDHALGRVVAVKRVRPDRYSVTMVQALLTEARVVGRLEHPNIVPVHALGRDADGEPLLVMKRVEGRTWESLLREADPRLSPRDRLGRDLEILMAVCNALEFAHRHGVVHCDLKPANVMVGDLGEVFLLDWGVAVELCAERGSDIAGTPAYMAPEMLAGAAAVDVATDVYLLGATLHELLTGRPPHAGATLPEVVLSILEGAPVAFGASVPAELGVICNRAMARDPSARFPSAVDVRDAIGQHLRHRSSMELAEDGTASLRELETALSQALETEEAVRGVRRRIAETDFAFRQALRVWPGNEVAAARRQQALDVALSFELSQRNGPGAKAILDELVDAPSLSHQRVSSLLAELASEGRAKADLERSLREQDFAVSARARVLVVAVVWASMFAGAAGLDRAGAMLDSNAMFGFVTVAVLLYFAMALMFRRSLLANAVNRRWQTSTSVMVASVWITQTLAWLTGQPVEIAVVGALVVGGVSVGHLAAWSEPSNALYLLAILPPLAAIWLAPGRGFVWMATMCAGALVAALLRLRVRRASS